MHTMYEEETTIPHVTRHDGAKTIVYALLGLTIAASLIVGTVWLFIAG